MSSYLRQSLGENESVVQIGRFHWMYSLNALMSIVWGLLACVAIIMVSVYVKNNYMGGNEEHLNLIASIQSLHPGLRLLAFFMIILGMIRFAQMMIIKATTEIVVTTSRIVFKRGLVARYIGEMSIDKIEGVNVLQTVMGRIFGYGRLMIRGLGVGEVVLPPIANPLAFRKAIDKARNL